MYKSIQENLYPGHRDGDMIRNFRGDRKRIGISVLQREKVMKSELFLLWIAGIMLMSLISGFMMIKKAVILALKKRNSGKTPLLPSGK